MKMPRRYLSSPTLPTASLSGAPFYLGSDQEDTHIILSRVEQTANGLTELEAEVCLELFDIYGNRAHCSFSKNF